MSASHLTSPSHILMADPRNLSSTLCQHRAEGSRLRLPLDWFCHYCKVAEPVCTDSVHPLQEVINNCIPLFFALRANASDSA